MPLFECGRCGVVENTALSNYWRDQRDGKSALCSECDPEIDCWHGAFPREQAKDAGYTKGADGFLVGRGGNA